MCGAIHTVITLDTSKTLHLSYWRPRSAVCLKHKLEAQDLLTHFCRYSKPTNYDAAYEGVKSAIFDGFYGPADKGIYSPSVQFTLYDMARIAIKKWALHFPPICDLPMIWKSLVGSTTATRLDTPSSQCFTWPAALKEIALPDVKSGYSFVHVKKDCMYTSEVAMNMYCGFAGLMQLNLSFSTCQISTSCPAQ